MTRRQKWLIGIGVGALGCAATTAAYLAKTPDGGGPATDQRGKPLACVADLSLGGGHTCVLFRNGRVHCYGRSGSLGTGFRDGQPVPGPVATDARFSRIHAGHSDTCGLARDDGAIWCWGATGYDTPRSRKLPVRFATLGGGFEQLGLGTNRVCGLRRGEVWCQYFAPSEPEKVLDGAAELYVRNYFGCARMGTGEVQCWGSNLSGELGRGTFSNANAGQWSEPAAPVLGLASRAASLRLSAVSACALTDSRDVWCWGSADNALFGDGRYSTAPGPDRSFAQRTPVPVRLPVAIRDLAMGSASACLLASDRSVWCWGAAAYNVMLGKPSVSFMRGSSLVELEPRPRRLEPLGQDNERIFAGGSHYCVQKLDRSIWCWGSNTYRQVDRELSADEAGLTRLPVECPPD